MQNKKPQNAIDVALDRKVDSFEIDPLFAAEASQYHRRQEIENKSNPVMRKLARDGVSRANQKEREEFEQRRDSIAEAERRWKEVLG